MIRTARGLRWPTVSGVPRRFLYPRTIRTI